MGEPILKIAHDLVLGNCAYKKSNFVHFLTKTPLSTEILVYIQTFFQRMISWAKDMSISSRI